MDPLINIAGRVCCSYKVCFVTRCLSDKLVLRIQYRYYFGTHLNRKNPKGFNEKLQSLKLHDRNPLYTRLVDKAEVKPWVTERIGWEHVVPTLGVCDSFDDIDFDELPERFVIKCTHDSGGLAICRDRATFDMGAARRKIEGSLSRNYFWVGREWPYKDVKPRVLAEECHDAGASGMTGCKLSRRWRRSGRFPCRYAYPYPRSRRREGQARGSCDLPRAAICFPGCAGGCPTGRRQRLRRLPDGPIVGEGSHEFFGSSESIGEAPEQWSFAQWCTFRLYCCGKLGRWGWCIFALGRSLPKRRHTSGTLDGKALLAGRAAELKVQHCANDHCFRKSWGRRK